MIEWGTNQTIMGKIPITDTIINSLAKLIDDAKSERRDPAHNDITELIEQHGLTKGDPNYHRHKAPVGKTKRVRHTLMWALENDIESGEKFAAGLISRIKSYGGFRNGSNNYVGAEAITNLIEALKSQGTVLSEDGTLNTVSIELLTGKELTDALKQYVARAKRGVEDAALLLGTSKDLIEAVAAHVLEEKNFPSSQHPSFPMLLGQAFTALEMATEAKKKISDEDPRITRDRALYELACSINRLRNKEGTGHGRPWLPNITSAEAKASVQLMGIISEVMLTKLESSTQS